MSTTLWWGSTVSSSYFLKIKIYLMIYYTDNIGENKYFCGMQWIISTKILNAQIFDSEIQPKITLSKQCT
jgi:hypothetical protein